MLDNSTTESWIWKKWLIPNDRTDLKYSFTHNQYIENSAIRDQVITLLARLIYKYHVYSPHQYNLLSDIGYPRLLAAIPSTPLPKHYETQVGNLIEILACELAKRNKYNVPVLRLQVNPNPDQSMKGDDILGFRFASEKHKKNTVLIGEAKFMKEFRLATIKQAVDQLKSDRRPYPLSIEFAANLLSMRGENLIAGKIWQLRQKLIAQSEDVEVKRLLMVGTQNTPADPFGYMEAIKGDLALTEYIANNIVFGDEFTSWLPTVYEYAEKHVTNSRLI